MLRACHVEQATGSRLSRLSKRKMKVSVQLSGPFRCEVMQPCGRRVHWQRQNVIAAVVHRTKRELERSSAGNTPQCDGRMCSADPCTLQASPGGNGCSSLNSMLSER